MDSSLILWFILICIPGFVYIFFEQLIIRKRIRAIRESILKDPKTNGFEHIFPIVICRTRKWWKGFPLIPFSFAGYIIVKRNESKLIAKGMIEEELIDRVLRPGSIRMSKFDTSLVIDSEDRYTVKYFATNNWGSTKNNNIKILDTVNRGIKFHLIK